MVNRISIEVIQAIIGISWAVMGIIFISTKERIEPSQKRYTLGLIITLTLPMLQCVRQDVFPLWHFFSIIESRSVAFLYGPALYLYVKKILNEPLKGFKNNIVHFIPFLVFFVLEYILISENVPLENSQNIAGRALPAVQNGIGSMQQDSPIIYVHSALGAISVLLYGIGIYRRIKQYEKTVDHHFSSHETDVTLSWLRNLAVGYIILFGLSFSILFLLSPTLFTIPVSITQFVPPNLITNIPLSIFILYFSIYGTGQKTIVIDTKKIEIEGKYKKSTISEYEMKSQITKLETFMQSSKIYLDPELTLETLAKKTEMTRHILSQVLNEGFHEAFYTFVNKHRIAEFEQLVLKGKNKELSILGLAFECGFKSSSSFYNALKKERGKTPKQLIKALTSENTSEASA